MKKTSSKPSSSSKPAGNEKAGPLAKVPVVPLSPAIARQIAISPKAREYDPSSGRAVILEVILAGADAKAVKVHKERRRWESLGDYLDEIDGEVIARVAEWLVQAAAGERWSRIGGGEAFAALQWLGSQFPIIALAMSRAEILRTRSRAERALERLEAVADEAEQDNARVKACEVLLRASHPAFGAATEAKTGSDRPIINVNLAAFFGESGEKSVKKSAESAEVVDIS